MIIPLKRPKMQVFLHLLQRRKYQFVFLKTFTMRCNAVCPCFYTMFKDPSEETSTMDYCSFQMFTFKLKVHENHIPIACLKTKSKQCTKTKVRKSRHKAIKCKLTKDNKEY